MFKVASIVLFFMCIGFSLFGLQIQNKDCSFKKKIELEIGRRF